MSNKIQEFNDYREKMNKLILSHDNLVIKRLFNLDMKTYQDDALSSKVKEMLGLATSMVLRCDDCIKYHLEKCKNLEVNDKEMYELFSIALLVGGSIVIPHLRRAAEYWLELSTL